MEAGFFVRDYVGCTVLFSSFFLFFNSSFFDSSCIFHSKISYVELLNN